MTEPQADPRNITQLTDGYRHLASAVLLQAAMDAQEGDCYAWMFFSTPAASLMLESLNMRDFSGEMKKFNKHQARHAWRW